MPRQETSRFKLSYGWLRGEDWWGDPVSGNFVTVDMLLHPYVLSMTQTQPPETAVVGDMFIVPVGAVDVWVGRDNAMAMLSKNGWIFFAPVRPGIRVRVASPSLWIWWTGTTWLDESKDGLTPQPLLGTRYDVAVSIGYEAEIGETLLTFTVPEAMTLPKDAVGSLGRAVNAPVAIHTLQVKRNGSAIGTISFIPGSVYAIFSVAADTVFAPGDLLTIQLTDDVSAGFENYSATVRLLLPTGG